MLHENLKNLRKAKGYTQEDLANRLHIVRQTVSKWEKGISVPDAEMLIRLADELDTSVGFLLGESVPDTAEIPDTETLAAQLEILNEQFAVLQEKRRKRLRVFFWIAGAAAGIFLLKECLTMAETWSVMHSMEETGGYIGGAVGSTQIVIAEKPHPVIRWILMIGTGVVSCIGLLKTKHR